MIIEPDYNEIPLTMKTHNSTTRSVFILLLVALTLNGCEKEHFFTEYKGIYGSWTIEEISGGISGGGYEPEFDILMVTERMHYSLYFHDTLLSEGKIEIIEQTTDKLRIEFKSGKNSGNLLTKWEKVVYLNLDTLILNDECCDMYSYFFVRTDK